MILPPHLAHTISGVHGERGADWISRLAEVIASCERRFQIEVQAPFPNLTYNVVLQAVDRSGREVVLKLSVPNEELNREIDAIEHFDGKGFVRCFAADRQLGALLLERVRPGTPLSAEGEEDRATRIFTSVVRKMKRELPSGGEFPTLANWAQGFKRLRERFAGGCGPLSAAMVERAEQLYQQLIETTEESVLLHGDLHHDNILSAGGGAWVAIDPKGVIGDPCFEPFSYLHNYLQGKANLLRRIEVVCAELGLERERVVGWGFAQLMLSASWLIEDGLSGWQETVQKATYFLEILDER
ncbi:aminoglycoside phosphotransferase family protein [Tumebacillus lipolyticus]|uniref:Aminoglycoside phosphotransferase family protein n=1 Tax=Tumebacillus lipolyticus TaxID=1280370 RepID=A0ABW4ZZ83_9BACL